jgi:hypothetical protein
MQPESTDIVERKPADARRKHGRSAVSNGSALLPNVDGRTIKARRFKDVEAGLIADKGGAPSEGELQLIRRCAHLTVLLEDMEARSIAGVPALDEAVRDATGGLSALAILSECSHVLHGLARHKGGDRLADMARLPPAQFAEVVGLFERAANVASKAAAFSTIDVAAYGALVDRLGRTLQRVGLRRQLRDVGSLTLADVLREDAERDAAANPVDASADSTDANVVEAEVLAGDLLHDNGDDAGEEQA